MAEPIRGKLDVGRRSRSTRTKTFSPRLRICSTSRLTRDLAQSLPADGKRQFLRPVRRTWCTYWKGFAGDRRTPSSPSTPPSADPDRRGPGRLPDRTSSTCARTCSARCWTAATTIRLSHRLRHRSSAPLRGPRCLRADVGAATLSADGAAESPSRASWEGGLAEAAEVNRGAADGTQGCDRDGEAGQSGTAIAR